MVATWTASKVVEAGMEGVGVEAGGGVATTDRE